MTHFEEQIIKEFDEEFDDIYRTEPGKLYTTVPGHLTNIHYENVSYNLKQFLLSALAQQREEVVKEIREKIKDYTHIYTDREILLMNDPNRILAKEHNLKLDALLDSLTSDGGEEKGEK